MIVCIEMYWNESERWMDDDMMYCIVSSRSVIKPVTVSRSFGAVLFRIW